MKSVPSLRKRFLLVSGISILCVLIAAEFSFLFLFERNLRRRVDDELTSQLNQISGRLEFAPTGVILRPTRLTDQRFEKVYSGLYWQIDDLEENQTLRSYSLWDQTLPLPIDEHDVGTIHRYYLQGPEGKEVYAQERALVVATPTGARTMRITAAIESSIFHTAKRQFVLDSVPFLIVFAMLLLIASMIQLALGLRPLRRVKEELNSLEGSSSKNLEGVYPIELRPLTMAINALLESQSVTIKKARERASDLAHGLKTPLTVLKNNAQSLIDSGDVKTGSEVNDLVQLMENRINYELSRSRIAPEASHRKANSIPNKVIGDIVNTLQKTPAGGRLDWMINMPVDTEVAVDPDDLRELLGNLLENAAKWSKASVAIIGSMVEGSFSLNILDDGPGIETDKIDAMMARGQRFDQTVPGTGIGLSIVRDIVDVYGLSFKIQNRQNSGLSVMIDLPLAVL